ncbi:ATP-binding protein [Gynuella sp.]|uniref:ATP-binding protein n=1 Tax=Gynuella sp. TaxID=2969146 RepID=UPI003D13C9DC
MSWRKIASRLNPWHTLFGKIFLWFWITCILIIAITSVVVKSINRPYQIEPANSESIEALASQARRVLQIYARYGSEAVTQLQRINELERVQIYLVDEEFRIIGLPRPPRSAFPLLSTMLDETRPVLGFWRNEVWLGPATLQIGNQGYYLLLRGWNASPPSSLPQEYLNETVILMLSLLLSGLLSAFLAWSFSRPLTKFGRAYRELAGGKLDTRIGHSLTKRMDEFGHLGRDFDYMASRLENLVYAQQRLLSNVSHELRSPITRIQVALGIAHQKCGPEAHGILERIERETEKLEQMIAQVLKLSRLENKMQSMEWAPMDLTPLLIQLADDANFEAMAVNKSVTLKTGHSKWIRGESSLLHSALENIVRNGIRYTKEHTTVEIETRDMAFGKADKVEILIRDHGPGTSEEVLQHLFEPFFRAVENTADGGAGLGLSIAEQVISSHNGTLSAKNHIGGGLEFQIQLPSINVPEIKQSPRLENDSTKHLPQP